MRKNPPWLQQTFILYPLSFILYPQILSFSKFKHLAVILTFWFIPPSYSPLGLILFLLSFLPLIWPHSLFNFTFLILVESLFFQPFSLFPCSASHFFLLSFCFFNLNLHFIFFLWLLFSHLANPILLHQLLNSTRLYHPPFLWWFFFHLKLACANQDEAVWVENRVHMGTCINTHARTQI